MLAVLVASSSADELDSDDGLVTAGKASLTTNADATASLTLAGNVRPVLVVAENQIAFEGTELDLSGMQAPLLGLFIDNDVDDEHTARIDWGDGSQFDEIDNSEIFYASGSGAFGGTHVYADKGTYTVTVRVADDHMSGNFDSGMGGIDFVESSFEVRVVLPPIIDLNGDEPGVDIELFALRQSVVSIGAIGRTRIEDADSFTLLQIVISFDDPPGMALGTLRVDRTVADLHHIDVKGQDTNQLTLVAIGDSTTLADYQTVLQTLQFVGSSSGGLAAAVNQVVISVTATDALERDGPSAQARIEFVTGLPGPTDAPSTEDPPFVDTLIDTDSGPTGGDGAASRQPTELSNDGSGSAGGVIKPEKGFAALDELLEAERALQRALTNPQSTNHEDLIDAVFSLGDVELVSLLGIDMGDEPVHQQANKEPVADPQIGPPTASPIVADLTPEPSILPGIESGVRSLGLWGAIAGSGMLWLGGSWWWFDRRRRLRAQNKGL